MKRFLVYTSAVIPIYVFAENEEDARQEFYTRKEKYIKDNFDLDAYIKSLSVEYIEYDGTVEERKSPKEEKSLAERGKEAAIRFLERRGYEIVDDKTDLFDIVVEDDGKLVFCDTVCHTGMSEREVAPKTRKEFETNAFSWLAEHSHYECGLRYDVIDIAVMAGDKALLKHHINAMEQD